MNPIFPFVSDLGVVIPGASFFTYSLCLGACFALIFFIIRYQITTIMFKDQSLSLSDLTYPTIKYQNYSFITGTVMVLAMIGVGSFRNNEIAFVQIWHNFFAFLLFFTFVFDMYFERCLNFILSNNENLTIRNILYYITAIDLILVIITVLVSFLQFPDALFDTETRLRWSNDDPGYVTHVLSCILEWILILLMCPYLLTYRNLFQTYRPHFFNIIQSTTTNGTNGSSTDNKVKTTT